MPRYAYEQVFRSKIFTAFFVLCFLYPAGAAVFIYLHHNVKALQVLQLPISELITIDSAFFLVSLTVQGILAFILTTLIGPGLISPDLSNNAMPLYLSRPFSRTEYILGKVVGAHDSAVSSHLGSLASVVPSAGSPGRRRLVVAAQTDRSCPVRGFLDLDPDPLAARAVAVGLGQMASGCRGSCCSASSWSLRDSPPPSTRSCTPIGGI